MKYIKTFKIILLLLISLFLIGNAYSAQVDFSKIDGIDKITDPSIKGIPNSGVITDDIKDLGFNLLTTTKYIFSGILLILVVYIGVQMILSMGTNEDDLNKSKKQILYILVGLIFINIPGTIYQSFESQTRGSSIDGNVNGTWVSENSVRNENVFINTDIFSKTLNGGIVGFIETILFSIAIFMIILAAYQMILSRGNSEEMTEAKNKILWSLAGLVFIGFIKVWQQFIFNGKLDKGKDIFETLSNLLLLFAGPVAIFFLTLAGYYFITSGGDEEKIKKAKSIITYTLIAIVILLASYTFLIELSSPAANFA